VTGLGAGINVFQWTISNGACASSTSTMAINVGSVPAITVSSSTSLICVGQSVVLTASSSAVSYTWSTGSNSISITDTPTVTTTYTVNGTDALGCIGTATFTQNVSPCTGIDQTIIALNSYDVYPNPTSSEITVSLKTFDLSTFVEVYNTLGQLIIKKAAAEKNIKLNLSELAEGVYHVRITNEGKQLYQTKVIKN
jgi:hypothetical protein